MDSPDFVPDDPDLLEAYLSADERRQVLPFMPMVYIAWADGDLAPEELARVQRAIAAEPGLSEQSKAAVLSWLEPARPPSPLRLHRLLTWLRLLAAELPRERRWTLADLGLEIASAHREDGPDDSPVSSAERDALARMEEALGIAGNEAARRFFRGEPAVRELPRPWEASAFEVAAMTRLLDGRHAETRRALRARLRDPEFAHAYGLDLETQRERTSTACKLLAKMGLGAAFFAPEFGGGGDFGRFLAAFETIGLHDLSLVIKFGVQFGLWGGSIHFLGTRRHHEEYLPRIGRLELPGCFAMTELGHGSNVRDLETTAVYERASGEFVIHTPTESAHKEFIGNAARDGRMATVFAQLLVDGATHGVHAFLVPIRNADGTTCQGVSIEDCGHKVGLNGVDNGRLWFDHVRIPRVNLLNRFADVTPDGRYESAIPSPSKRFFTMLSTLVGGRIGVASAAVSAGKTALTIAVRHGARRRQFGPEGGAEIRLLDYQAHQRRLMPLLATTYALDFSCKYVMKRFVERQEADAMEVESLAAGIKAFSTAHCTRTLQTCRECCGGQGYLSVNRLGTLKADSDVFTTFEGDNTVLYQLVAKSLLTRYKRQFQDMSVVGMLWWAGEQMATRVAELNPVVVRMTSEEHLRDPAFLVDAFAYRENALLASVAGRLREKIRRGMETFTAFNECQDHLLTLAQAHVQRVVLEQFNAALAGVENAELRGPLRLLRDLFALSLLEEQRGWYLEEGYFEAGKARAVRTLVLRLCREAREHASALVEAFAIPDECLGAPIGRK
ncbi:MAG: acyl-CoA dehydrogenase family protein [Planctomycetes bacterium]|nr:acyl-CoA dehydrogenase family protein [Planctomycetota bacterium]